VTGVIEQLNLEFGALSPLTVTRGKVHDYLGMTLDYSTPGKVRITMSDYIANMLDDLPNDMGRVAATPAANCLFEVNTSNLESLDKEAKDVFHTNVAKLLFLSKWARPDIQTAVGVLCTRVKSPDRDDYNKLKQVMKYLQGTIKLPLTLEADGTNVIKTWVDASFVVHHDMRSQTGRVITLGRGAMYSTSTRQKLNTRSSTESELVAMNDVLPQVLWTRYFLREQGYEVYDALFSRIIRVPCC